jgi:two-component system, OmpR family, copper resistance phosphate regulon response regulator CusR
MKINFKMAARILVIEDERMLAEILRKHLLESDFLVDIANDGYIGKSLFEQFEYDLVILDINLPIINGYELCKEFRKTNSKIPVIMLTAFGSTDNKIVGFEAGADDYVIKPFDFRELLARINVFLKRSNINEFQGRKLVIDDLELDIDTKTVTRSGKKIDLTSKEFTLLETLLINKYKVLSREYILEKVWDLDFETGTNIIDVYVNYLRKKIDKDFDPKLIHTKFGFGFYCSETEL